MAVPKPEYFDKIDLDRVMQMYKERFENANGMHFTFVGSISENDLKPFLKNTLPASLLLRRNLIMWMTKCVL